MSLRLEYLGSVKVNIIFYHQLVTDLMYLYWFYILYLAINWKIQKDLSNSRNNYSFKLMNSRYWGFFITSDKTFFLLTSWQL
jgi:hypothetical protein